MVLIGLYLISPSFSDRRCWSLAGWVRFRCYIHSASFVCTFDFESGIAKKSKRILWARVATYSEVAVPHVIVMVVHEYNAQ